MPNTQLNLFGDEYCYRPSVKKRITKVDKKANLILNELKDKPIEVQQGIVCEMYYLNICDQFDKMPERIVQEMVVKLLERYLNRT